MKKVTWAPNTEVVCSCGYDDTVKLWIQEDEDWICHTTLTGHGSTVWFADFTSDGSLLATVSDDHSIRIWKKDSDPNAKTMYSAVSTISDQHSRTIYACSWNSDSSLLATV